jgi:hypothetical protein
MLFAFNFQPCINTAFFPLRIAATTQLLRLGFLLLLRIFHASIVGRSSDSDDPRFVPPFHAFTQLDCCPSQ